MVRTLLFGWKVSLVFQMVQFNQSKFVIAINPNSDPVTWSLVEFVDDGKQACILGFGRGAINIGQIPFKEKGVDL